MKMPKKPRLELVPGRQLLFVFSIIWLIIFFGNLYFYYSILGFAGTEDVYAQRESGASKNAFTAYSQTLFSTVFSPVLFIAGLLYHRRLYWFLGLSGSLFIFLITAQRTVLLLPFVIYLFYKLQASKRTWLTTSTAPLIILAACTMVSAYWYESNLAASAIAVFLVFRTIALPGLTYTQYYDLFSQNGFTWWSHVKGLSFVIPVPAAYQNDNLWPGLGYMVGRYFYGLPELNANANLFSGDGIAAAGALGVVVIGLAFAAIIRLFDRLAQDWSRQFVVLAMLPFAVSLTNGHLFTSLLSFGGLVWMAVFLVSQPKEAPVQAV